MTCLLALLVIAIVAAAGIFASLLFLRSLRKEAHAPSAASKTTFPEAAEGDLPSLEDEDEILVVKGGRVDPPEGL